VLSSISISRTAVHGISAAKRGRSVVGITSGAVPLIPQGGTVDDAIDHPNAVDAAALPYYGVATRQLTR
jgi:hypothetical protein